MIWLSGKYALHDAFSEMARSDHMGWSPQYHHHTIVLKLFNLPAGRQG